MSDVVIAGYVRSAFTPAHRGALANIRPDDIAAAVVRALVERTGVDPRTLEDLILGCAFPEGEQGLNAARLVALNAGLPRTIGGVTVNRFCGSSMQAVHMAAGAIRTGAGDAFVCAGMESMSRVPMGGFNPMPNPALYKTQPEAYMGMGETAENVASRWSIDRAAQDAFALESQQKAARARAAGHFADEIIPVSDPKTGAVVDTDGCPRPDTTLEGLAGLTPAFLENGTVTAGTASPLTDGAAAVLVCSATYANTHGLTPMATVRSLAISGCDPDIMGMGPVESSRKALRRAGLAVDDIDIVELNEAFAAQALACIRELELDPARINRDGGAIALGHPLGATGARIVGKAAALLAREGGRYALSTQCIGGGQGIATVLERA